MRPIRLIGIVIVSFVILSYTAMSDAGTFMLGAKGWYTIWESSVLDWFEKDLTADFASAGRTISTSKDDGTGYLAGPFMSYQTNDGKWSISFAPMFLSSFSQDWQGTSPGMNMQSDVDVDRIDIDLAVNYTLNKYSRLFFGYKYQDIDIDFTLSYDTLMGNIVNKYELEQRMHIPTIGAGFVYTVLEKLVLGLQLGLLYSIPDVKMKDTDGITYDIWTYPTFGFNGEFTMNYRPIEKLIFQLGYRYQYFRLDVRNPDTYIKTESDDISHGPTLSAVWVF